MRFVQFLCRRGILGLLAVVLVVVPAYADDPKVTVDQVRETAFPSITVQMTLSTQHGTTLPAFKPADFAVQEDGQSVGVVNAYPLYDTLAPLSVVMAIDVSGSMNDEGKLNGAKQASKDFIAQLRPVDEVELLSFNDHVTTVVPFTRDRGALNQGLDHLTATGSTVLYDAADRVVGEVLRASGTRIGILITDGNDTASQVKLPDVLARAKQSQIAMYTIGLGSDSDDAVLGQLASTTGGRYFKAPHASDLAGIFGQLNLEVANRYEFTYFSPRPQQPGKQVNVTVALARAGGKPLTGQVSYTMPPMVEHLTVPVDPGVLQPVVEAIPTAAAIRLPSPPTVPVSSSPFSPRLAALLAAVAFLTILGGLALSLTRDAQETRLANYVNGTARSPRTRESQEAGGRLVGVAIGGLASLAARLLPTQQIQQVRLNLALAGNPNGWRVEEFLGIRMLVALAFAVLGYFYGLPRGPASTLLGVLVLGALGYLLPAIWLGGKIRTRQRAIFRAMPNALDMIAVTVEAGLGFDQAVSEVCQKWQNELTREFALFLAEVQMGRERREALRGIITRTGVPELSGFVGAVIQADELGTGIARTLTIQAEQLRIKRRQHAEKLAHEAAIKMTFPLVFLIFPAIFAVLLGPAIPLVLETFSNLGK